MEELRALNETLFIGVAVVVKKEDERQDILFVRKIFCFFFLWRSLFSFRLRDVCFCPR